MSGWRLGWDPAALTDWSALGVAEITRDEHYLIRHLVRWRGVDYVQQVHEVAELLRTPQLLHAVLTYDRTGLGVVVGDLLQDARRHGRIRQVVKGITISSGQEPDPARHTVPKAALIGRLQVLFEQHRIEIADDLVLAPALRSELRAFKGTSSEGGRIRFEAASGSHDDLVLALALCCWSRHSPPTTWRLVSSPKAPAYAGRGSGVLEGPTPAEGDSWGNRPPQNRPFVWPGERR